MSDIFSVLKACKPDVHPVEVSGGTVYVRDMDGAQYDAFRIMVRDKKRTDISDFVMIGICLCDHNGTLVFPQPELALEQLKGVRSADIKKIARAVMKYAGMLDTAEDLAEKEKKS